MAFRRNDSGVERAQRIAECKGGVETLTVDEITTEARGYGARRVDSYIIPAYHLDSM